MKVFLDDPRVAVVREAPHYSKIPPYHPSEKFPEWTGLIVSSDDNPAYRAVRELLYYLKMDYGHYDTSVWNPLGEIIHQGDTVILKPNFVAHRNLGEKYGHSDTDSLITHGSVLRAVLDYAAKALRGEGKIIIGDCPIQGADWEGLCKLAGLQQIREYFSGVFPGIKLLFKDYRLGKAIMSDGEVIERKTDETDISNYSVVDLRQRSELLPIMNQRYEFGVVHYSKKRMKGAHTLWTNKYIMHNDLLTADTIINIPKMKTHMKTAMTGALKNFVGLVAHKDYLPHFRYGSPKRGGDEYPDGNWLWDLMWFLNHCDWELEKGVLKTIYNRAAKFCVLLQRMLGLPKGFQNVGGGSWYGNDTLWRTVLDINRAFFYFDRKRQVIGTKLSSDIKYLGILDGLIGGEKESPLMPTPVKSAVMMAAFNPLSMDAVAAAMMGLDIHRIKLIANAFSLKTLPIANFSLEDIKICGSLPCKGIREIQQHKVFVPFEPSRGFKGYVEFAA